MKFIILALSLLASQAFAAKSKPTSITIDTAKSSVVWVGKKVTGEHTGNVNIKEGNLTVENDRLVGGEFELDMASISNSDLSDAEWNKKLVDHLKHEDFFNVEKYKTAKLKIKNVILGKGGHYDVMADLTIRGVTKPVLFKAELEKEKDSSYKATSEIVFNRADYGLKYNSGKFFDPKTLGDKLIYDDVTVKVSLKTKKL